MYCAVIVDKSPWSRK